MSAPRAGLQVISGVGPDMERHLNPLGVFMLTESQNLRLSRRLE